MSMQGQTLFSPGDTLAGYRIEGQVARGGFAVVYRARDLSLGRQAALKVIAPELAGSEKFRQRFMRESELAASIDHPNILPIYGAGEENGILYLAMRFVDGQDLGMLMSEQGQLPFDVTLPLFTQVAAALDVAHAHGLVHRDVKPGNILVSSTSGLTGDSHVYLADFGLTKRSSSLSGLTTARHFIGTPAYAAPEQISGETVDARTDIYAMGCVLYEALTGVPPFQREDDMALLWAHVYQEPEPPSTLRPNLPPHVDEVLARTLAKRPEDRPDSCRSAISELRVAFRDASAPRPRPQPLPASRPQLEPRPEPESRPQPAPPEPAPPPAPGDQGSRRPDRTGRRRLVSPAVAAALVVSLAVVAVAGWLLLPRLFGERYLRYEGTERSASWLAFDQPSAWQIHPHLDTVCFCTDHYGPTFLSGDWSNATRVGAEGGSVQGMLVRQVSAYPLQDASDAMSAVRDDLRANRPKLGTPARATVGNRPAWRVDGTITDSHDSDQPLQLSFRYYLVTSEDARSTDLLILFSQAGEFSDLASTMDRVIGSVQFRADG